jgi:CRP/FNR family cyclic AMP-dependent transcriptional regulator
MDRTAAARAIELAPTVDLLERLGIFDGTTPQQLEALAAVTREERVPVGSMVIREGDEPDDLFAIADGTLEVRTGAGAAEHMVASLGAGDYVGEIGLLEKRPRTATVVAVEPARLLRIPGEDFLRIVNDAPRISPTLISVVASRLAASQPDDDHEQMGRS